MSARAVLSILTIAAASMACSSAGSAAPAGAALAANDAGAGTTTEAGETDSGTPPREPTQKQRDQADSIAKLVDELAQGSAWHKLVDADAVKKRERDAVLLGDGADVTFIGAAWRVMNAFPQGHQSLYSTQANVCGRVVANQTTSAFGVCGRPAPDGVVVTFATASNRLGLHLGDVVVKAGAESGDAILEASYLRPTCGYVYPALSGRRTAGASSFFGHLPAGTVLTVRAPNGATREVTIPDRGDRVVVDCTDPFARDRNVYAEAKTRPDGVAVIRLPSFFPFDKQISNDLDTAQAQLEEYQAAIAAIFDTVKTAPGIVWDARGNSGGFTPVALAIVGGFPTAQSMDVSYCKTRDPGTSPPAFSPPQYAEYAVTKGGPFAYSGKVAIVTDGLAYSAGDYFPFVARKAANAIVVGTSTAGAFGGGFAPVELAGPPSLTCNYDPTGCFDATTHTPLEGNPPAPTLSVDYDPNDLAAGRDTMIERAVQALGL